MLYLSMNVQYWLDSSNGGPQIGLLTVLFFTLNVLAATQDIAVDGWALTMLKRFVGLVFNFELVLSFNLSIVGKM